MPRLTRRCRADAARGRAGILVKPAAHPLEGDSATRGGGRWAKKDAAAIARAPRCSLALPPRWRAAAGGRVEYELVLALRNPRASAVALTVAAAPAAAPRAHLLPDLRDAAWIEAALSGDAVDVALAAFDDLAADDDDDDDAATREPDARDLRALRDAAADGVDAVLLAARTHRAWVRVTCAVAADATPAAPHARDAARRRDPRARPAARRVACGLALAEAGRDAPWAVAAVLPAATRDLVPTAASWAPIPGCVHDAFP